MPTEEQIQRLREIRVEDEMWRSLEANRKVEIEFELALFDRSKLIVQIDAGTFDRGREESDRIPVVPLPAFQDRRTSVGRDIAPTVLASAEAA